jgi:DNA-binding NtrC family response regulator
MHDFVQKLIESSADIDRIVDEYPGPRSPVINALALLSEMVSGGQTANGALFIARNTDIQKEDSDLGIILLTCWASALILQTRQLPEKGIEALSVIHRARNLITPSTPKEVLSLVDMTEAQHAEISGNIVERDSIMRRAIKRLSPQSGRIPWLTVQYAVMLARSGRLSEISRKLSAIETSPAWSDIATAALLANFINHVETCNIHQAEQLLNPLSHSSLPRPLAQLFDHYRTLLPMLRSTLAAGRAGAAEPPPADEITPDWALVIKSLASGNPQQALKWARISEKREPACLAGNNLISFNLLRSEIAVGNIDAARRLSSIRRSHGNTHFLDNLFEARIFLLEGSTEQAADLFATATVDAGSLNAKHRIEIEVTLAVEVPHHQIMYMCERSYNSSKIGGTVRRPLPVNAPRHTASGSSSIIGASQAADELRRTVIHFARMDIPIMITGETGTGKDLIAHAIHEESDRRERPFVAVNCASISESLLESELFGHEKGAFTGASTSRRGLFEEAGSGFIFLDEIGEISPKLQAALLRVLETGEIRPVGSSTARKTACRIITATNADLSRMAMDGRFRQDILFRLKRLEIHIPPLRERVDDILPISHYFLNLNRAGDSSAVMSEDLCRLVMSYSWPGNVRELRNMIERMRLMNSDKLYYEAPDIGLPTAPVISVARSPIIAESAVNSGGQKRAPLRAIPVAPRTAHEHESLRKGKSRMRRMETLRSLFRTHQNLTRSEIIDALSISPNAATSDLKDLIAEGYIDRVQPSRSPRSAYFTLRHK